MPPPRLTTRHLVLHGLLPAPAAPRGIRLTTPGRAPVRLEIGPDGLCGFTCGLPMVEVARRPFARSPGRWAFRCPACSLWVEALHLDTPAGAPDAAPRWACRRCHGLQHSHTSTMSVPRRTAHAAAKAARRDNARVPGEKRAAWLRRIARAEAALKAEAERLDRVRAKAEQALAAFNDST